MPIHCIAEIDVKATIVSSIRRVGKGQRIPAENSGRHSLFLHFEDGA